MALVEGYALVDQPIYVWRNDVRKAEGGDGVVTLLVREKKNYIWLVGHGEESRVVATFAPHSENYPKYFR